MDKHYIYPMWMRAKRQLTELVVEAARQGRGDQIHGIVDKWFREHCFEFGVDTLVSTLAVAEMEDYLEHVRHQHAGRLGQKIFETGLYAEVRSVGDAYMRERIGHTILVFGVPKLVGPGTREAEDAKR